MDLEHIFDVLSKGETAFSLTCRPVVGLCFIFIKCNVYVIEYVA